ncbi:MAG: DUF2079 domain-containing protein [Chloroflexi bacterium]|nr:DUF2079 domain-containing protein [Chloroflexota bacterium]
MKMVSKQGAITESGFKDGEAWMWLVCALLSTAWAVLLIWMETQKFLSFQVGGDMGIYAQVMWSMAHGCPFYMSLLGGPGNFLGHHFAPLMILLAPFYRLWPDARFLLVTEVVALALTVAPLYIFARKRLGPQTALLIVLAFLLYPPLHFTALTDFHEIHLAIPLLMASTALLIDKRLRLSIICLALAMLVKEEVTFIAIGFGVYIALAQRRWCLGMAVVITSLLWGVILFQVLIPILNGGADYTFYQRYATLGATPREMLNTLTFHPVTVWNLVTTPSKLLFVFQLLAPLAALPLLGFPSILLAVPTLGYLLLSDYGFMTSITFYYTAPLIPFLF